MDISETRRLNLKIWFTARSIPPKEKSYISQLSSGKASFGERAARRIESDYGMSSGWLDIDHAITTVDAIPSEPTAPYINCDELIEIITRYKLASRVGKQQIMTAARAADTADRLAILRTA